MKELNYKICWRSFDYIDELSNWFDQHRECELISFSVGKNRDSFIAIYKDYKYEKETNFK